MWDTGFLCKEMASREAFIGAMRNVASSVTVVTTDGPAGRHGATVSAFCSVSADPPSALVCLYADCRIARCVAGNGVFCVNVLPRARQDIADRFAGRHDDRLADRFDGMDCVMEFDGLPIIEEATAFVCEVRETVEFGSHRIFIGHVMHVLQGSSDPLTYLDGAYHGVVPQAPDVRPEDRYGRH